MAYYLCSRWPTFKALPAPSADLLLFPEHDSQYVHFEDGQRHPFDRDAQICSRVNAWWLADAALLAYWDEQAASSIWARAGLRLEFISRDGVQCHVGYTDGLVIVSFRGTQVDDPRDLLTDAQIEHRPWDLGGSVHKGFRDAHDLIWPSVKSTLQRLDPTGRATWFTGHSMGAALATLAMDRWPAARGLYTIGSPVVGDRRFARRFNQRHAGRVFRYVNYRDIVVYVAGWLALLIGNYTHVKERRYIDAKGTISTGSPSVFDWLALVSARRLVSRLVDSAASGQLQLLPGPLVDHTPRRYAVRIWNDYASSRQG